MDNEINNKYAHLLDIHQHYMDIINSMPNAVYWVDLEGNLLGYNSNFLKLLAIESLDDAQTIKPYSLLVKHAGWQLERAQALYKEDLMVIASGKSRYNFAEDVVKLAEDKEVYYVSTRVPLLDKNKKTVGLVVILIDIDSSKKRIEQNNISFGQHLSMVDRLNGFTPRVLLVEDNSIAQKVAKNLLERLGCEVDLAENGESSLHLFTPGKYDVIFMDIGLQDTSGYMVAKKIREQENGTDYHVPIIALTSYTADVVKHDCREYFMAGAITKPLTMDQAEQIIQHYIYNQDVLVDGLVST